MAVLFGFRLQTVVVDFAGFDFVQNAIEQYTAESGKLVEMGNQFFSSALRGQQN